MYIDFSASCCTFLGLCFLSLVREPSPLLVSLPLEVIALIESNCSLREKWNIQRLRSALVQCAKQHVCVLLLE